MHVLGISAYYHDSAACLVRDGEIVAAAQEERFTRKKHDPGFPLNAARYCLKEGAVSLSDLKYIVFYDKPLLKFDRLLETYLSFAPKGLASFIMAMPVWLKEKLFLKNLIEKQLSAVSDRADEPLPEILYTEHHESHAASAFYPSPFPSAAVLCVDGVGEWATTTLWHGRDTALRPLAEIRFPHSLGLLYSAVTYFCGFKVDSGEYKLMGLAPYGKPRYAALMRERLIDIKPDGSFHMNMRYFEYLRGHVMTGRAFEKLFGGPRRTPEGPLTDREFDLAASVQAVTEEVMLHLARAARERTGESTLCLAGGVALNCVANGKIVDSGLFDDVWIQPAAGDAGGALGAALAVAMARGAARDHVGSGRDAMSGALLGPAYGDAQVVEYLWAHEIPHHHLDPGTLVDDVAAALADGKIVGWFQDRMEFGPRALGARSILGDPRDPAMQSAMNLKIKFRESFRPFAPAVLAEDAK